MEKTDQVRLLLLNTLLVDRRGSTNRVYNGAWKVFFSNWCIGKEFDPEKVKVQNLLEFLQTDLE